jgi:hypothetical protein
LRLPEAVVMRELLMAVNELLCFVLRAMNPLRPGRELSYVLMAVIIGVLASVYEFMLWYFGATRSHFAGGVIGGCGVAIAYFISGCIAEWKNRPPSP